MTTPPFRPLLVLLLLNGVACDSDSGPERDGAIEDGGRREPDAGDAADASAVDANDVDSTVDELADPDAGDAGDAGPDEPTETLELASYCEQLAALYYEYLHACYGAAAYPDSEREQRVEAYRSRCMQVEPAIEAGRVAFDDERAHSCVEDSKVGGCARQFGGSLCEGVFQGLLEPGDDCYGEETLIFMVGVSACADGFCDEQAACPGTCRALPERGDDCDEGRCHASDYCDGEDTCRARKAAGESCVESFECPIDFVCTEVDDERTCRSLVLREGGACSASEPCGGVTTCLDGECTFARSLGEPCALQSQCPEDARCILSECAEPGGAGAECTHDPDCQPTFVCNTTLASPECVALPVAGEPCVRERCEAGASCRHDVDDGDGTCRAQVGPGDSCLVGALPVDDRCQEGLHCVEDGTCEPPGELGEPCAAFTRESCVEELWCSRQTYTCQASAGQGEPCNPAWLTSCAEGLGCDCGVEDTSLCSNYPREHQATDTCQPLVEGGGDCFRQGECMSGSCVVEGASAVPGACFEADPLCLP
jgi:hypothetical protein